MATTFRGSANFAAADSTMRGISRNRSCQRVESLSVDSCISPTSTAAASSDDIPRPIRRADRLRSASWKFSPVRILSRNWSSVVSSRLPPSSVDLPAGMMALCSNSSRVSIQSPSTSMTSYSRPSTLPM